MFSLFHVFQVYLLLYPVQSSSIYFTSLCVKTCFLDGCGDDVLRLLLQFGKLGSVMFSVYLRFAHQNQKSTTLCCISIGLSISIFKDKNTSYSVTKLLFFIYIFLVIINLIGLNLFNWFTKFLTSKVISIHYRIT